MYCLLKATQGRQHKTVGGSVRGGGGEGGDVEGEGGRESENLKKRFFGTILNLYYMLCYFLF